ncbi:MAG: hypothetical protein COA78_05270 [Blastopirellula sp.]|nr:MAG: hypothetical protein COA78_05270 [Blastopirellula sp.]
MQIQLKDPQPWVFQIKVNAKDMQVNGTAEAGWIQPGMYVSFTGVFDDKGISQAPVASVTVFTPSPSIVLGVTKEEAAPDFINGASEEAPASSKFAVLGRVTGKSRDGKLTVAAGSTKVAIELTEDAAVKFEISAEPRLIRLGDTIEGEGWYFEKGKGIMDKNMTVTSAEPLKGPEVKKRRTTTKRTTEKKTEEAPAEEPKNISDEK